MFIDSSQSSLKVVLLHNGNIHPSIPIAHSAILKERYENVKKLLDLIKYKDYAWEVIGDFKMVARYGGAFARYGSPDKLACV